MCKQQERKGAEEAEGAEGAEGEKSFLTLWKNI
jgi:hypothetical protein